MDRVPFFIEVPEAKDKQELQLCSKISALLAQKKVDPLPFAANLKEVEEILVAMKQADLVPAIFVINTFGAKEILAGLDPLIGETPALFLRRGMFAGRSGLMDTLAPDPGKAATMVVIGKLTPRLTSVWAYGSKNSAHVAQRAADAVYRFLQSGDFRDIEIATKLQEI